LYINSIEFWAKILVSVLCGGIIGFERQIRGKPAGIRTSILICLGTEIFVSHGTSLATGISTGSWPRLLQESVFSAPAL
jgi:putative Mg2+ transporter-C (MgtC) family protein